MKFTAAALVAAAGVVVAQSAVPDCAVPCLTTAVKSQGCSGLDDMACACKAEVMAALATDATMIACLTTSCSGSDLSNAISGGQAMCAAFASGGASSAASSTTAEASSSAAKTTTAAATTSAAATTTMATTTAAASNKTVTTSATPSPPIATAGAAATSIFGMAAFLAVALAL